MTFNGHGTELLVPPKLAPNVPFTEVNTLSTTVTLTVGKILPTGAGGLEPTPQHGSALM